MIKILKIKNKFHHILNELKHHSPFTALSVLVAMIILGIFKTFWVQDVNDMTDFTRDWFHIFHPLHIILSATATTAMFWRYERKLFKSIIVGLVGSLMVCGISDSLLPFIGGSLLGVQMELHWCLLVHPETVVPFAIFGVCIGIVAEDLVKGKTITIFSHSFHVLISTMATLLFLISFGFTAWFSNIPAVFLITFIGVVIPCCFSDIILPLLVNKEVEHPNDINPLGCPSACCFSKKD